MPGEVTLGLLLIVGGVLPVIGAGATPGVAPNVPIVPNGAPGAVLPPIDEPPVTAPGAIPNTCRLPKLGIATLGALPNEPGAELNVPPVIGAGPTPGVAPNVPIVPNGAPRAAGWAKHTGAAAINAAATACTMNFCLSMRVSFDWQEGKSCSRSAASRVPSTVDPEPRRQFAGAAAEVFPMKYSRRTRSYF
jgi:hypothetical protein